MTLDLLKTLEEAGEPNHTPVQQKIPRMWLSSFIRWPIRIFALGFVLLDSLAQKIAKTIIRSPFKKVGACKQRGNCCHYILMAKVSGPLGFFDQFWHTQINGFYLRSPKPVVYEGKRCWLWDADT